MRQCHFNHSISDNSYHDDSNILQILMHRDCEKIPFISMINQILILLLISKESCGITSFEDRIWNKGQPEVQVRKTWEWTSSCRTLAIHSCEGHWLSILVAVYHADTLITHLQANCSHPINIHPFCFNKNSLNIPGTELGMGASMAALLPK